MSSKNTIASKLENIWGFIDQTLTTPKELETAIAAGFTKKEFETRLKQFNAIIAKRQEHNVAIGRRKNATKALNESIEELQKHYAKLVDLARNMYEDDEPEKHALLGLEGRREKAYSEMKFQVFQFYTLVLNNKPVLDDFANKRITKAFIEKGITLYKEILELKRFQESAEMLRSEEYDEYDEDFTDLDKWYRKTNKMIKSWKKLGIELEEKAAK
ncbi:hypothetical protein R9C00_13140 [Flammeovirgaceae bacterium SG7u.111]|nr:hypothetical protein [Flammeovirgaceae bacterium SG7u.132]WPO38401.1 hypothetical protein R9C00_13140 [Flammeovirgaceae bacterium SG7u.111]